MNADTQDLRARLDLLQESLAIRQSTTHFAHTGVSTIAALLIGGASAKLFHDSLRTPHLAYGAAVLSLALLVYGLRNYWKGRAALADELKRFEALLELRSRLSLDNPAALLPR
ncbi:hypothetical protein KRR26_17720 [Corallococcus sp. M34]|uniref:hypothetical protein n=1 Tax=Citreicoccus inhibens TaxID=2849499 RepID=UPI0018F30F06|nr:hypothetical protein [Citreicoccus inhibens]MBU8897460.1 hypothetical protein [Citreicoccus inhibens]